MGYNYIVSYLEYAMRKTRKIPLRKMGVPSTSSNEIFWSVVIGVVIFALFIISSLFAQVVPTSCVVHGTVFDWNLTLGTKLKFTVVEVTKTGTLLPQFQNKSFKANKTTGIVAFVLPRTSNAKIRANVAGFDGTVFFAIPDADSVTLTSLMPADVSTQSQGGIVLMREADGLPTKTIQGLNDTTIYAQPLSLRSGTLQDTIGIELTKLTNTLITTADSLAYWNTAAAAWRKSIVVDAGAGGGEANTYSAPAGSATSYRIIRTKSGVDLPFKNIVEGTNVTIDSNGTTITINSTGAGETNTASNLGGGLANFDSKSSVDLRFNSFLATDFNLAANQLSLDRGLAATWTAVHSFVDNNLQINNPANTFQYIFGTAALAADRTIDLPLLSGDDVFTFNSFVNLWGDGIKQTFNPDATNAGLNAGSLAGQPSAPADGDIIYNTTANQMQGRVNGAWVDLGAGAGGGETNTASNLGGGLANFDSKSGVDLRFNSFLATDFNLAANLLSIDPATAKVWTGVHSFADNNFQINNPANTFQYIFGTAALAADRTVELPLLTGTDTFTFNNFAATLSNKTLDSGSIISGFGNIDVGANSIAAGSFDASGGNFTNLGNVDLDLIRADAVDGSIIIELDNAAGADLLIGNNNALVVEGDNDQVGIGTASPTNKLTVDGNFNIANGNAIIFGHDNRVPIAEANPEIQTLGTSEIDAAFAVALWNITDALSPTFVFLKSGNATIGSFTTVADNEELGKIQFYGDDGTDHKTLVAEIASNVDDGSVAAGQIGGELQFKTATSGGTITTAITINNVQDLILAGNLQLDNPANTFQYIFNTNAIVADRIVTLPLLTAGDTFTFNSFANAWGDGVRQTFNPDGTTPGLNFGSQAGDPSTPSNGDAWYNSSTETFRARENGANVNLVGGGTGETNTASNLGGGLANFDSKVSVDLRFNTFLATDFNLSANQLSIDSGTAKTWTGVHSFADNNFQINNPANTFQYIFGTAALAADRIVELPLLTGTDTFVFNAFAATLTNKTFALANNTFSGTEAEFETAVTDDNPVFDGDFGSNGVMVRTAAGAYTNRTITGTVDEVVLVNGDGVSGNPTVSLPDVFEEVMIPAGYFNPKAGDLTGATALADDADNTNDFTLDQLEFSGTAENFASGVIRMPPDWDGSTAPTFRVEYYTETSHASNTVDWEISTGYIRPGTDTWIAAIGTGVATAHNPTTLDIWYETALLSPTPAGTAAAGAFIKIRLKRDGDDATNDTHNVPARLVYLIMAYLKTTYGDETAF